MVNLVGFTITDMKFTSVFTTGAMYSQIYFTSNHGIFGKYSYMYVKCCTSLISNRIRTTTLLCADTRAFSLDTLDSGSTSITDLQKTRII